jgi:hypothetical protein
MGPGVLMDPEASLTVYEVPRNGHEHESVCRAGRDIALAIIPVTPPGVKSTVLGMSPPLARTGLNVRVFNDRIN